jgi:CO dehydrogenase/acetyl-CoA synthase beta subunit
MQRGFQGKAPDGETWDGLANRAGGKQADGVSGLSLGYLRSPQFLKGDGGLGDLVWTTSHTLEQIRDIIPEGQLPATEADVRSLEELREFLAPRGGR